MNKKTTIKPSKELLAEVLDYLVTNVSLVRNNHINITGATEKYTPSTVSYNIYELEQKCKEWAYKKGYSIISGINTAGDEICHIMKCTGYSQGYYYEQSENYENVFQACEWILKEAK